MRSLLALCVVAACAYPEPKDRCDGDCAIYAIDRPMARPGTQITLEGTFDRDTVVQFPGTNGFNTTPIWVGPHRARVVVPDNATPGGLIALTNTATTNPISLRVPTFEMELQPFVDSYEQSDVGRVLGASPSFSRIYGASVTVGDHLFLIGGSALSGSLDGTVDSMVMNADATITEPVRTSAELIHPRSGHAAIAIGGYVYVFGGTLASGPTDSVEGSVYDFEAKQLATFGESPMLSLRTPRTGLAVALVGNYVYAIGGKNNDGDVAQLERAPIYENGLLGDFEMVSGVSLKYPRSGHTVAVVGDSLYVVGGFDASGSPVMETERFELFKDAFISDAPEAIGPLTAPRGFHTSVVVGDYLYVIGGWDGTDALATIERTKLSTTFVWEEVTDRLRLARFGAMLATVGDHVYVMGGKMSNTYGFTTFERASIIGHRSASTSVVIDNIEGSGTLTAARSYPTAVVLGNSLYVIGGSDEVGPSTEVQRAEIGPEGYLSTFTSVGSLTSPRMAAAAFIYDNYLYVAGGRIAGTFTFTDTVERAPIKPDGSLGPFELQVFKLDQARGYFKAILTGRVAHAIGGMTNGQVVLASGGQTALDKASIATFTADNAMTGPHFAYGMLVAPNTTIHVVAGNSGSLNVDGNLAGASGGALSPWMAEPQNPTHCQGLTTLALGDTVFAIGGSYGSAPPPQRALMDADGRFTAFIPTSTGMLAYPVYGHASVQIGNFVYVLGGNGVTDNLPKSNIQRGTIY